MTRLLTEEETADILGRKRRTIHVWAAKGRIPAIDIGTEGRKMYRFNPFALAEWLERKPYPRDPLEAL
jgi:excisionase family DNA binding protein